jgi:feruloyl esterase
MGFALLPGQVRATSVAPDCAGLVDAKLVGATVESADAVAAGAFGGKLILYHGWNDPLNGAGQSIDYYRRVRAAMGETAADRAVRLFLAPGVEHCEGGPGSDSFGQFSAGSGDPAASLGAALQRWVEQGLAPERVIASKLEDDNDPNSVVRARPLCAYPRVASYRGEGNTDVAASFDCADPEAARPSGAASVQVSRRRSSLFQGN